MREVKYPTPLDLQIDREVKKQIRYQRRKQKRLAETGYTRRRIRQWRLTIKH